MLIKLQSFTIYQLIRNIESFMIKMKADLPDIAHDFWEVKTIGKQKRYHDIKLWTIIKISHETINVNFVNNDGKGYNSSNNDFNDKSNIINVVWSFIGIEMLIGMNYAKMKWGKH